MAQNASGAKVTSTFCVPHPAALSVCKGPPVHAPRSVQAEATLITVVANLVAVLVIFHGILSRSLSKMSAYDRAKPTRSYETYFDGTILLRGRTRPRKQLCKERGKRLGSIKQAQGVRRISVLAVHRPGEGPARGYSGEYFSIRILPSGHCVVDFWVFADMRGIPALGNAAIDMHHESIAATWSVCFQIIKNLYEKSSEQSCLRRFLVESHVRTRGVAACLVSVRKYQPFVVVDCLLDIIPHLVNREDYDG
jgi:hypothetical protein